jgi:lysine/ornithine N-monooxygenase
MGGFISGTEIAKHCKYNKKAFRTQINMIHNAHEIVLYYSKFLLLNKMPSDLEQYPNYDTINEKYFNTKRNEMFSQFESHGINNFYDFYKLLDKLPIEYKRSETTESERRKMVEKYVEIAQSVLQKLIEELYESCDVQGKPIKK